MKKILAKFLEILKVALTKFSAINMTQYIAIGTLIISSWSGANVVSASVVLMLTGLLTLIFKAWQSVKEMVSTGFSLDWTVWLSGILSLVIGFLDTWITDGNITSYLFGDNSKIWIMVYLAITIILRTGFTNQDNVSIKE